MDDAAPIEDDLRLVEHILYQEIPVGIVIGNPEDGKIMAANRNYHEMLGYEEGELLGRTVIELMHPDDQMSAVHAVMRIVAGETDNFDLEKRYLRKDGSTLWVRVTMKIVRGEDGAMRFAIGATQDISERKRAEEKLSASEHRYRTLVETSPDPITLTDLQGTIILANRRTAEMAGVDDPATLVGRSTFDFVAPEDRLAAMNHWQIRLAKSGMGSILLTLLRADGTRYLAEVHAAVLEGPDGVAQGMICVARDITARKRVEEELRESENNYRMLMEQASDAIFVADRQYRIVEVNSRACAMLGFTRDQMLGREVADLVVGGITHVGQMLTGETIITEGLMRCADGGLVQTESSVRMLSDGRFQGIVRDITERKRAEEELRDSEQRFRAVFERGIDAMYLLDDAGCIEDANPAALELIGRPRDEVVGHLFAEFLPPAVRNEALRLGELLRREGALEGEAPVAHPDGVVRYFRFNAKAHFIPGFHLLVVSDISERKQAEEARRARAAAEAASKAKSDFLSRVSHELRTPLNVILGFGQLLSMSDLVPADRESVEHILTSGRHLLGLVDEVLDITTIEQGGLHLQPVRVDVEDLLRAAVEQIRPAAARRDLRLVIHPDGVHPATVLADQRRAGQVLLILLSNAVKYNRPGGRIDLSYAPAPGASPARLRIAVADTGIGIPEDKLPLLFTPFERLGAEQRGIQGTGLDLVVAKLLVEAMGGQIGAESAPGLGSTFWFDLPLA